MIMMSCSTMGVMAKVAIWEALSAGEHLVGCKMPPYSTKNPMIFLALYNFSVSD